MCITYGGALWYWNPYPSIEPPEPCRSANCALRVLTLNGAGAYVPDFPNHGAFKSWILSANAVNMAYMLSAQLAAMKLNATIGDVNGASLLLAASCGNTGST